MKTNSKIYTMKRERKHKLNASQNKDVNLEKGAHHAEPCKEILYVEHTNTP